MGLLLSVLLSYAGTLEAVETVRFILSGLVPGGDPKFDGLVLQYSELLRQASSKSNTEHWTQQSGQGYLCIKEDEEGKLSSAAIKYYGSDSTALLFSTKISSFGDSVDSTSTNRDVEYGNKQTPERYTSTTTTIIPQTIKSFSVGSNRSPTGSYENISDSPRSLGNSFERRDEEEEKSESKEKLVWHYRPLSPSPQGALPEIHFQSYDREAEPETPYSEDFLRSLDGIKFRPLQRNDPSGRRRSFKTRHSSSSTSSRDSSKASREEELRAFTSLEEAEFDNKNSSGYGSAPNLTTRSHSRSRSREKSKESKPNANESLSTETSADCEEDESSLLKPRLKDLPKLGSFEEEKTEEPTTQAEPEVTEAEVTSDELDDFWGNSDD